MALLVAVVRALTEERWASTASLDGIETEALASLFGATVRDGGDAAITDRRVLEAFGLPRSEATAMTLWRSLADRIAPDMVPDEYGAALEAIVAHGSLARRMRDAHRDGVSLPAVASRLIDCLARDRMFLG